MNYSKKIIKSSLTLILITFLTTVSSCNLSKSLSSEMLNYYQNGYSLVEKYYSPHTRYASIQACSQSYFNKNFDLDYYLDGISFDGVVLMERYNENYYDIIVIKCYSEEDAIAAKNNLNYSDFYNCYEDLYNTFENFVYMDCQVSYLFIYGEPLEKDGFLYYELENGKTLLFGDVCNCTDKIRNEDLETIIPDWIDIIGGGTTLISEWSTHNPNAKKLIIPNSVEEIKQSAFSYSQYETIVLSSNLKSISSYAFDPCDNLKSIIIPKSVEHIGFHAFTSGIIYCEASAKPNGWNKYFAGKDAKVYYSDQWEYDENGEPKVK